MPPRLTLCSRCSHYFTHEQLWRAPSGNPMPLCRPCGAKRERDVERIGREERETKAKAEASAKGDHEKSGKRGIQGVAAA